MTVYTAWPALIPAIIRAGHEPVLVSEEVAREKYGRRPEKPDGKPSEVRAA
jgi:hypothetical protein